MKNQDNESLKFYRVQLVNTQDNSYSFGFTDSSGVVSGAVPKNATLQMNVYNKCGDIINTQNIGQFSTSTDIGVKTINVPGILTVTISGAVLGCNSSPVASGEVNIVFNGLYYSTRITNGIFSITIDRCSNDSANAQLQAIDFATNKGKDTLITSLNTAIYNTGNIIICDAVTVNEFLSWNINGTSLNFTSADAIQTTRSSGSTFINVIRGPGPGGGDYSTFSFDGDTTTGMHITAGVQVSTAENTYSQNDAMIVNITEYGRVGEYIAGSFS